MSTSSEFAERLSQEFKQVFTSLIFKDSLQYQGLPHRRTDKQGSLRSKKEERGRKFSEPPEGGKEDPQRALFFSPTGGPAATSQSSSDQNQQQKRKTWRDIFQSSAKTSVKMHSSPSSSSTSRNKQTPNFGDPMSPCAGTRHLLYLQVLSVSIDSQVKNMVQCDRELKQRLRRRHGLLQRNAAKKNVQVPSSLQPPPSPMKQDDAIDVLGSPQSPTAQSHTLRPFPSSAGEAGPNTDSLGARSTASKQSVGDAGPETPLDTTTTTYSTSTAVAPPRGTSSSTTGVAKSLRKVASSMGIAHPLIEDIEHDDADILLKQHHHHHTQNTVATHDDLRNETFRPSGFAPAGEDGSTSLPSSPTTSKPPQLSALGGAVLSAPIGGENKAQGGKEQDVGESMSRNARSPAALSPEHQRELRLVATRDALNALLWVHKYSVLQLRQLVDLAAYVKWTKHYWSWAQVHPFRFAVHCFWSSPWHFLQSYRQYYFPTFPFGRAKEGGSASTTTSHQTPAQRRTTFIVSTLSQLNALQSRLTESIGRIHSTLYGVVSSLKSLNVIIDETTFKLPGLRSSPMGTPHPESRTDDTDEGITSTKEEGEKESQRSNKHRGMGEGRDPLQEEEGVEEETIEEDDSTLDISDELEAILRRALPSLSAFLQRPSTTEINTMPPSAAGGRSGDNVKDGRDVAMTTTTASYLVTETSAGFDQPPAPFARDTEGGGDASVPTEEASGLFGGGRTEPNTPSNRPRVSGQQCASGSRGASVGGQEELPYRGVGGVCSSDPIVVLRDIAKRTVHWNEQIRHQLMRRYAPPRGRHWYRLVKYTAGIALVTKFLLSKSITDHVAATKAAFHFGLQFVLYYGVLPARSLWSALTVERYPSELRKQALQEEINSLSRMVVDYHNYAFPNMNETERLQVKEASRMEDLGAVVLHYENAVQHPIRAAMFGQLFRIMLIQLQKQKVEIDRVLLTSEEVLEQNDVNFRVMALAPLLGSLACILYFFLVYRNRVQEDPLHRRLRFCWRGMHRTIAQSEGFASVASSPNEIRGLDLFGGDNRGRGSRRGGAAMKPSSVAPSMIDHGDHGQVLLQVHEMRSMIPYLKVLVSDQELALALEEDLDDIENTEASREKRMRTLQRMYMTYSFLHPPTS